MIAEQPPTIPYNTCTYDSGAPPTIPHNTCTYDSGAPPTIPYNTCTYDSGAPAHHMLYLFTCHCSPNYNDYFIGNDNL